MVWRLWRQLSTTPVTFVNMIVDRHTPLSFTENKRKNIMSLN